MNSTNHQCCCTVETEAGPSQLTKADNNANLMNQSQRNSEYKGAIPKTKPAVKIKTTSSKKSAKHNNNIEEIPNLASAVQRDVLPVNGVSINSYFSLPNEASTNSNKKLSGYSIESPSELKNNDSAVIPTCNGGNKDLSKLDYFHFSDEDDTLSISDDGCIYTYKGDQDADLPVSFFSLDMPIESPNPINNRRQSSSPEMDFLEMDFDPGPTGEDFDSIPEQKESQLKGKDSENIAISTVPKDQKIYKEIVQESVKSDIQINRTNNVEIVKDKKENNILVGRTESVTKVNLEEIRNNQESHAKMPWTCNISERTVATTLSDETKKYHCTKGELLSPTTLSTTSVILSPTDTNPSLQKNQNGLNCDNSTCTDCCSLDITTDSETVMIWTEQEACLKQIGQIGPSACGATAVLNVLNALKKYVPSEMVKCCINTRLRANLSPLTEYLISRSVAGTTHVDIIDCLHKVTDGQMYARFFHMYPERVVNLRTWLTFWISKGAVPIATLNLQKCRTGSNVPDAWHHQMIYGVCPKGIHLCNPIERVAPEALWPQLCSESILLVRREDVLSRWNVKIDLPELMKIRNYKWRSMNVVGQVANLIFESRRELRLGFKNTSHIKIPAAYSSGITLVIPTNSPSYSLLKHCPELPILSPEISTRK